MPTPDRAHAHPAWLPATAFRALGSRQVLVLGDGPLVDTVVREARSAADRYGGRVHPGGPADLVLALLPAPSGPEAVHRAVDTYRHDDAERAIGVDSFLFARSEAVTVVVADDPAGLLYGFFHVVRLGESAFGPESAVQRHRPAGRRRMVDDWDNVDVHPVMGQVERGYAGGSLVWRAGALRDPDELARVGDYARLLAACGVNALAVNNVNVHATEARLLTDRIGEVATVAALVRPYGIRVHLSVSFAAPIVLGGLATADPLDAGVRDWWGRTTRRVYDAIPDFGGFLVKADSEGQPGPFVYGRTHADGANLLADALAPYGGVVHWRAFVYNHRQDWRDRSTDRARAAYDHFAPLDGQFHDNAILQVKHGPLDFQVREPVSPVIAALRHTRVAVEFQATAEYTGQQQHVCYLGPMWSEVLGFRPWGPDGPSIAGTVAGGADVHSGDMVVVSNVGDDVFWTGHPLAQANLYAFGRLAWDPELDPVAILDEWIELTFDPAATADPDRLRRTLHELLDTSWSTYEQYTAPLGVGFMVHPGDHYGPDVDGYEYSRWGTYHRADRDGVGIDRTRATGTGYTGQYPPPWSATYEAREECPDEVLLFFHHVPYGHVLHSGSTVIQHIYDTHFAGVDRVDERRRRWAELPAGLVDPALHARVSERLDEQLRCAREWRDQVNTYFFRKSGVPDAHGRTIY